MEFHSNKIVDYRLLSQFGVRLGEGQSIVGAGVVLCGTSLSVDTFTAAAEEVNTDSLSYSAWRVAN
jgi:hypothetical protein